MAGGGPDLDSWTAGQQSRDLQRDAPTRLGICAMFVALGVCGVLWSLAEKPVNGWWLFPFALLVGVLTELVATNRAHARDAWRVAEEPADRKKRKDAELAAFLKEKNDNA